MESEYFPRGKVPPSVANGQKGENEGSKTGVVDRKAKAKLENLFASTSDAKTVTNKKKLKRLQKLTAEEERLLSGKRTKNSEQSTFQVVPLSYDQLVPDMLMLGVVHEIYNDKMLIVLPGRATGVVQMTNVSKPYNTAMKKHQRALLKGGDYKSFHPLSELFSVGQVVIVKVSEVRQTEKGHADVQLTLNPNDIHSNYNSSMVTQDLVLVGAVQSEEDKGYQIDLGISDVFAFLPFDHVSEKRRNSLIIGQLIYCKVKKVTSGKSNRSTVIVSMNLGKIMSQIRNEDGVINYSSLLPGMLVNTVVEKSHESGLKLSCFSLDGLVHSDHMQDEWAAAGSITVASELHARVLYVHPNLTTPYLTLQTDLVPLKRISKREDPTKIGSLQMVRVVNTTGRGVIVRLAESNEKGFISLHHLGDGTLTSKEEIAKKFKVKSEFECRILKYAHFERMYICTLNKQFMNSTITDIRNATPGEKVKCEVVGFSPGGVMVKFGREVNGFIPKSCLGSKQSWMANQDETRGTKVNGRILYVDMEKKKVVITLHPHLLNSKGAVISSLSDAKIGEIGHGFVYSIGKQGAVLKTIGGVKGFIPASKFKIHDKADETIDLRNYVKYGEVLCYKIEKIEADQLLMRPYHEDDATQEDKSNTKKKKKLSQTKGVVGPVATSSSSEVQEPKKKKTKGKKRSRTESENTVVSVDASISSDMENRKPCKKRRKKSKKQKETMLENDAAGVHGSIQSSEKADSPSVEKSSSTDDSGVDSMEVEESDETTNDMNEVVGKELPLGRFWDDAKEKPTESTSNEEKKAKEKLTVKSAHVIEDQQVKSTDAENEAKQGIKASIREGRNSDSNFPKEDGLYWTNLILHYTAEGLIEKARSVAKEALNHAPIAQKSTEAFKVYRALFKLEVKFGTEDTAKQALEEAVRGTDDKYQCYKMAAVTYEKEGRFEDAQKIYRNHITRECGDNVDGWINFARLYFENGRVEDARNVFHSATSNTTTRNLDEVCLTSRYAILEIYHGDVGKGCMLIDTLLQAHSQRTDIWVLYVQALIKQTEYERARNVFRRAFEMEWKPQKIRNLLAYYKTFEANHGNEDSKNDFTTVALKVLGGMNVLNK